VERSSCSAAPSIFVLEGALKCYRPVVSVIDGDTLKVLHNRHPERIRLPQSQRHPKERRDPLNRKNGEAHILACHHLSYGHHKIQAAIPTKMATNRPGISAISMIPSWIDGGFDYGFL